MPEVTVLLYGVPRLEWDGRPLVIERRKAVALAAYLALSDGPRSRDELAALLWPELSQDRARAALRTTLPALTGAAPISWVEADRRAVGLKPAAVRVDVVRFMELVGAARAHHHGGALCADCAARLRAATALYTGDLLQGFSLPETPDFEAWQLARREALRRELAWALQALAEESRHRGPAGASAALVYAQRWLDLDPLNEPAHRLLMMLYADSGRRSDAVRQYQSSVALLQSELRADPSVETVALFEQISGAGARLSPLWARAEPRPPDQAVGEQGSFVGRASELAWLTARLREPDCRLVTLTGPGGIGKTRLALRAAAELAPHFADGAHLVALNEARSATEAIRLAGASLGVELGQFIDPLTALTGALGQCRLLLVLDNLEQLPGAADLLLELLVAAPGLKLLATSRERLGLRAETLLPLDGLPYPAPGEAEIDTYGAVQLFVQRARQVRPDFALTPPNRPEVAEICRLVEGMPLGIELAASWVSTLTPAEIGAEIAHSSDFLQAAVHDLPKRHRSLRAVFEHSWCLLSPDEQRAFRRLAVFRGGCTAAAAQVVAEVALADLAALTDSAMLRRTPDGRYRFHPLLQQYAAERLAAAPAEEVELQARHCRFMAELAAGLAPGLAGSTQTEALAAMSIEEPNLRAAWGWAVAAGDRTMIGLMLDALTRFYELRGYRQEGETALAAAVARLEGMDGPGDEGEGPDRLIGRLYAWRGHFCQFLGRYDQSEACLERALSLAGADEALIAFCRKGQGVNANARGDHIRAVALHRESLALARALGDRSSIGDALNRLGGALYDMSDLPEARACWEQSFAVYEDLGDLSGMARALNNLGEVCRILGEHSQSRRLSERSLALHAQIGRGWQSISPLNNLGMLARLEGRFNEARGLHDRSLAACRAVGDARNLAMTTLRLAELELAAGNLDAAEVGFAASLRDFRALGHWQGLAAGMVGLAELALRQGAYGEAAALAREGLTIAEAIPARLTAGQALCSLGLALALSGEASAGAAALADAEAALTALGARPDALLAAKRRRQVDSAQARRRRGQSSRRRRMR